LIKKVNPIHKKKFYCVGISVGKISKICQNLQKSEKIKNFNLLLNQSIIEF
jgi:hypothetical protein